MMNLNITVEDIVVQDIFDCLNNEKIKMMEYKMKYMEKGDHDYINYFDERIEYMENLIKTFNEGWSKVE